MSFVAITVFWLYANGNGNGNGRAVAARCEKTFIFVHYGRADLVKASNIKRKFKMYVGLKQKIVPRKWYLKKCIFLPFTLRSRYTHIRCYPISCVTKSYLYYEEKKRRALRLYHLMCCICTIYLRIIVVSERANNHFSILIRRNNLDYLQTCVTTYYRNASQARYHYLPHIYNIHI